MARLGAIFARSRCRVKESNKRNVPECDWLDLVSRADLLFLRSDLITLSTS